jgi:hypothetical protein
MFPSRCDAADCWGTLLLSPHFAANHDGRAAGEIITETEIYGSTLTPAQARAIYEKVERVMR